MTPGRRNRAATDTQNPRGDGTATATASTGNDISLD
jgi:hypothetical protein